jgi:phospholipase C
MQLDLMKNALTNVALVLIIISFLSGTSLVSAAAVSSNFSTSTPIKHLVVIFEENVSYDHYFGTYPKASKFKANLNTPSANGLNATLLNNNHNSNFTVNPLLLNRSNATTCDMNHGYSAEQNAYHRGLADKFVEFTGSDDSGCNPKQVMGHYDGNTVTALWNYAQHFSMSDNSFGTTFGPSTLGAINLISE